MLEKVSSLTDDEISRLKDTHGVVLFHMDGCGHCVNMMPAWNRVMTDLKDDMKNEIILGAIERSNMEKFHQHGIKPKVNGFPTVLYFHPSKLHSPEVYNKDRSYEEFKKWIMEKSRKGKGKGKTGNNVDNKVLSEIKNYDKHMKRVRERFIGNSNEIIMGQEGGGRHRHRHRRRSERSRRSRRSRRNRLRRTRKHRRTHSRRARSKSCSKLDVKSGGGGGCGCGKLW
uniref:Thioredoxin domain-containing protein n=1 Tax=viral metagenome TaxID=1070528 RepID=A0A6C0EXU4_9ZZZZ